MLFESFNSTISQKKPLVQRIKAVENKRVVRGDIISDVGNAGNVCYFYTTDTDLDTSNDIPVDEDYAMHHKFAEEDHNPQGFTSFSEYGNRQIENPIDFYAACNTIYFKRRMIV